MKVLVCGGRDFANVGMMRRALMNVCGDTPRSEITIIHGAARGADIIADKLARNAGCIVKECPADWRAHGKAAGPIRNRQMLADHNPDVVLAMPGGRGTADMVSIARAAGVRVIEWSEG
jgi:hypothetical protein